MKEARYFQLPQRQCAAAVVDCRPRCDSSRNTGDTNKSQIGLWPDNSSQELSRVASAILLLLSGRFFSCRVCTCGSGGGCRRCGVFQEAEVFEEFVVDESGAAPGWTHAPVAVCVGRNKLSIRRAGKEKMKYAASSDTRNEPKTNPKKTGKRKGEGHAHCTCGQCQVFGKWQKRRRSSTDTHQTSTATLKA